MRRIALLLMCVTVVAGCGKQPARRVRVTAFSTRVSRRETVARPSTCARRLPSRRDYGWPIKPFDVQHPVRANFGDPRTISAEQLGLDASGDPGDYSFHNGVDISAKPGTPVYPVVSGIAELRHSDEVLVHVTGRHRNFQYWHIEPTVRTGQRVIAERTVLGTVLSPARHVHLTEIDGDRVTNPARHLRPYDDRTTPVVHDVMFADARQTALDPEALSADVSIVAEITDSPPLPVPGAWAGFPVTPALVRWSLLDRRGQHVLWRRRVIDFRRGEPEKRSFWTVYAAGTYQNFPVFDHRFFWRHPGRYLFRLTNRPLDTRRLPNGAYELRVVASDICGNRGTLTERVRIAN
jgi:hypothetical protein